MQWYKFNINDLDTDLYNKYYNLMSEERKSYVSSFKSESARKRTVAAEMLIKTALDDDNIVITKDEYGKPFLENCNKYISISHSGDYAVCAVSDSPIGIDIEKIRNVSLKISEKFCNAKELVYINEKDSNKRFFKIWTAKESAFKLYGGKEKIFKNIDTDNINKQYFNFNGYTVCVAERK